MARKGDSIRKRIEFDAETWQALDGLAKDRMATIHELADEVLSRPAQKAQSSDHAQGNA
jgi:hypothetical protein